MQPIPLTGTATLDFGRRNHTVTMQPIPLTGTATLRRWPFCAFRQGCSLYPSRGQRRECLSHALADRQVQPIPPHGDSDLMVSLIYLQAVPVQPIPLTGTATRQAAKTAQTADQGAAHSSCACRFLRRATAGACKNRSAAPDTPHCFVHRTRFGVSAPHGDFAAFDGIYTQKAD